MRVGLNLDIVLETDLQKDQVVTKKAMVYDVQEQRIIISQTSPPLSQKQVGAKVNASYIAKDERNGKRRTIRMGCPATILEYVEEYPLSSSNLVPAFVLKRDGKLSEINLRMHYRVRPTAESGIELQVNGEKVNLIDISIGGVQFSHRKKEPPLGYGIIPLRLSFGGRTFKINGRIVRIDNPVVPAGRIPDLEFVMVKFLSLDREAESFLSKKILMIERELIAAGKV